VPFTFVDGTGTVVVVVVVEPEEGGWDVEVVVVLGVEVVTLETGELWLEGTCNVKTPKNPATVAPKSVRDPFMSFSSQML
jgi:hypothetical protein